MRTEPSGRVAVERPVFVAGPDRSGTTLMFALLASHPDLCMVRRTNMWRYFYRRYGDLEEPANLDRCLDDMVRYRRMRHLQPDADRIRREFRAGPPTYGRLFALFQGHNAERLAKVRWGDKSLHTEHFADDVFSEFPDGRIVHMIRDPRDRYASVRHRNGQELSRVGAATGRWLLSTRAAIRNHARYPDRYLIVRYEDLTRAPAATMRQVCDFVDLSFRPEMLEMGELPELRAAGGNSSFGDMEPGAISVRAVGRFRSVVPPRDVAYMQLVARRAMDRMGYEREPVALAAPDRARLLLWELPVNGLRMFGWMAQARFRAHRGVPVPQSRLERGGKEAPPW
jgi:Sulfotransferase family